MEQDRLWPHCPWVQPSILEADEYRAVCGCGWSSDVRGSVKSAQLAGFAHLDDVRRWVAEAEAALLARQRD